MEREIRWRQRFGKGGICDFRSQYDHYFKYLVSKVMSLFIIDGGDSEPTVNKDYAKMQLILDGGVMFTRAMPKGDGKLYAVDGNIGGEEDEYYIPVLWTVANKALGSAQIYWRDWKQNKQNGVLVTNTSTDKLLLPQIDGGLYKLIHQTATLLADNIISINCCQINSRVVAFAIADSEPLEMAARETLQRMYAGSPYQVLRSDMVDKLEISPLTNTNIAATLAQLMELQSYIIGNFLQSIGISANNVRKKERMITDEIESQNNIVALSITEMLESWKRGFDEVNNFFGTDFSVRLNPTVIDELLDAIPEVSPDPVEIQSEPAGDGEPEVEPAEPAAEEPEESPADQIEEAEKIVEAVAAQLVGEEVSEDDRDSETEDAEDRRDVEARNSE